MDFNATGTRPGARMKEPLRVNTPEERSAAARLLVRKGYAELLDMLGLEAQTQSAA